MVIDRVLDPSEIARLHDEQRSNPWVLFADRPIWVPVTAPSSTYTLSIPTYVPGSLLATSVTPRVTRTKA
jgi:hypothetical protein